MSNWTGIAHKRTDPQNKSLHLFCEQVASELNSKGINIQLFLKHAVDLDWTKDTVKELIWRPIQKALLQKGSTTELDKVSDIDVIWEHINRHLSMTFGISVDWPHRDTKDEAPLRQ
jgi:uncharacterized protein with NAD-binding domain and iron-sulfur cluster